MRSRACFVAVLVPAALLGACGRSALMAHGRLDASPGSADAGPVSWQDMAVAAPDAGAIPDGLGTRVDATDAVTPGQREVGPPAGSGLVVEPHAPDLGTVAVGAQAQEAITVVNETGANITDLAVTVMGADITLDARTTCHAALAAAAVCYLFVDFRSNTVGAATGDSLLVTGGGQTKAVTIVATVAAAARLAASPSQAARVATRGSSSVPLVISVSNYGGIATGPLFVTLAGSGVAEFLIVSDSCSGAALPVDSLCGLTVAYVPALNASDSAMVTLTISDHGATVATVLLTGTPQ